MGSEQVAYLGSSGEKEDALGARWEYCTIIAIAVGRRFKLYLIHKFCELQIMEKLLGRSIFFSFR